MVKSELVKKILEKYQDLNLTQAERIVDIFFRHITRSLMQGGRAEFRGFGSFYTKSYQARLGRNPRSGEVITIAARKMIFFKTSRKLIKLLNK